MINLDTNTAIAFVAEDSSVRHILREFVKGQQLVIAQTALNEFINIVQRSAGVSEQARANRFLQRVMAIPDRPSPAALTSTVSRIRRIRCLRTDNINITKLNFTTRIVTKFKNC